jgi:hypothetical protein
VHVTCVSLSASDGSDVRSSFERYCHSFEDAVGLSDAAIAERINSAGVRLLIDLNGFTHGARSGVVAMRPAPVTVFDQVSGAAARGGSVLSCVSPGFCRDFGRPCDSFQQRQDKHECGNGCAGARARHVHALQLQPPQRPRCHVRLRTQERALLPPHLHARLARPA